MTDPLSPIFTQLDTSTYHPTDIPHSPLTHNPEDTIKSLASSPNPTKAIFKKALYLYHLLLNTFFSFLRSAFHPLLNWYKNTPPKLTETKKGSDSLEESVQIKPDTKEGACTTAFTLPSSQAPSTVPFLIRINQQPKENILQYFVQELIDNAQNGPMKQRVIKEFFECYLSQLDDQKHYAILLDLIRPLIKVSPNKKELLIKIKEKIDDYNRYAH